MKYRALRLDQGNFSWATEATARKVRIIDVVYNASNNELVRTKTLVKGAIVTIDSTPFRQWYESHYAKALGRKITPNCPKKKKLSSTVQNLLPSKRNSMPTERKPKLPLPWLNNSPKVVSLPALLPDQVKPADATDILEGKELDFYVRKLK